MFNLRNAVVSALVILFALSGTVGPLVAAGATSTLFSDGFETGNFSTWTFRNPRWTVLTNASAPEGGKYAQGRGSNGGDVDLSKNVATDGYETVALSFFARSVGFANPASALRVEWTADGSAWSTAAEYSFADTAGPWTTRTVAFPAGASDNPNFGFRFAVVNGIPGPSNPIYHIDGVVLTGNTPAVATGAITGKLFNDKDANGTFDGSDANLAGWTVAVNGPVSYSTTTDASGVYTLDGLTPGDYTVCETLQATWSETTPTSGPDCSGSFGHTVTIVGSETVTGKDFGNIQYGTITLEKITDPEEDPDLDPLPQDFSFTVSGPTATSTSLNGLSDPILLENIIPGSYTITEAATTGWALAGVTCDSGVTTSSVEGGVSFTLNAAQDASCTFENERLGSVSVTKIADPAEGTFTYNLTGPTTGTTDITVTPGGPNTYTFENLTPGSGYSIEEVLPQDWEGALSNVTCTVGSETVSPTDFEVPAGEIVNCVFNSTQFGSISGLKFRDASANGVRDEKDPSLQNWTINLRQDGSIITSALTTTSTGYIFTNLEPGTYEVCEVLQSNWIQSFPASGFDCGDGSFGYSVSVAAGENKTGNNFGNYKNGSIGGKKFNDLNHNGKLNAPAETVIPGWSIELYTATGTTPIATTTTGEDGKYRFNDLHPATYVVKEVQQSGWTQTWPVKNQGTQVVKLKSGANPGSRHFGNFRTASLTGFKWNDVNADGVWQTSTESGIANWTIFLDRTDTSSTQVEATTTADGSFAFPIVATGTYRVSEEAQANWLITSPSPTSSYDIDIPSIASGQQFTTDNASTSLNFGNVSYVEVLGTKFAPTSGSTSTSPTWLVIEPVTAGVATGSGTSTVDFSDNSIVMRTDAVVSHLPIDSLTLTAVATSAVSGLGTSTVDGVLQLGIPSTTLEFTDPFSISIFVGAGLDDQTLDVQRSTDGTTGWTTGGIVSPATCVVSEGLCDFEASSTSYFAVTHAASSTGGGDGGGNGGGGGGGGTEPPIVFGPPNVGGGNGPGPTPTPGPGFTGTVLGTSTTGGVTEPSSTANDEPLFALGTVSGNGSAVISGDNETSSVSADSEIEPATSSDTTQPESKRSFLASVGEFFHGWNWLWVFLLLLAIYLTIRRMRKTEGQ